MCWVLSYKSSRCWLLASFNQLQGILCLDDKLVFVAQEISIVSEDAIVSCAWYRNAKCSIHVVSKLEFQAETHGLAKPPGEINANLLFGDSDVETLGVYYFNTNIGHVIKELAFKVAILISIVEYSEARGSFYV